MRNSLDIMLNWNSILTYRSKISNNFLKIGTCCHPIPNSSRHSKFRRNKFLRKKGWGNFSPKLKPLKKQSLKTITLMSRRGDSSRINFSRNILLSKILSFLSILSRILSLDTCLKLSRRASSILFTKLKPYNKPLIFQKIQYKSFLKTGLTLEDSNMNWNRKCILSHYLLKTCKNQLKEITVNSPSMKSNLSQLNNSYFNASPILTFKYESSKVKLKSTMKSQFLIWKEPYWLRNLKLMRKTQK